ncbi:MAG: PAS domain S-box protein [Actinomycetota bacterium]|nr:PAS domain S-box protein [Actinomycetota bacterium]
MGDALARRARIESLRAVPFGAGFVLRVPGRKRTIPQEHIEQPANSRERFKEVFEHSAVGAMLVEPGGRIAQANHSVCDLLGYTERELAGKTIRDITHPDDLDTDLEQLDRLLGGEVHAYQIEKRYIHRDGHTVWGILSRSLVRDEYGNPLYFISQIQDISGRKTLEESSSCASPTTTI